jgi:hypothetical protein
MLVAPFTVFASHIRSKLKTQMAGYSLKLAGRHIIATHNAAKTARRSTRVYSKSTSRHLVTADLPRQLRAGFGLPVSP